jgi:hypothetical protein
VLAALRADAAAQGAQQVAAAAVDDWASVAQFAAYHDVGWWVARALPRDGVPVAARLALADAVRDVAVRSLAGARQAAELASVLATAGVPAVAYKGPALAVDVHGDAGARRFNDLDVLVNERDVPRARRALGERGYAPPRTASARAERFYSRWEGVAHLVREDDYPVELHWRCQAPRYGGPQDPADVIARARRGSLADTTVLLPAAEDLAVLLALHGAKHGWTSLLWVVDFDAAVRRPAFDWALFQSRATAWNVTRAARFAVLVVHVLVAPDLPTAVLAWARADARAAYLADAVAARLTMAPHAPDIGTESTARYDLQWLDGAGNRLRYLALAAFLPTAVDGAAARLPDALLPLAYPVRAWRLLRHAFGRMES